jgi:hypothetical protein
MLGMMLLDTGVLMAIVMGANEETEISFFKAFYVVLAISIAFLTVDMWLLHLGEFAQGLALIPLTGIAGLIIWISFGLTLQRAMIGGAIFLVYKILIGLTFGQQMS